jgi:DNA-binding transcriptional LysR family regulator
MEGGPGRQIGPPSVLTPPMPTPAGVWPTPACRGGETLRPPSPNFAVRAIVEAAVDHRIDRVCAVGTTRRRPTPGPARRAESKGRTDGPMIETMKLQAFVHSAERLSFTEAAEQLHVTQPTVSHHIKSLETEMGVALFERSGSGLKLTEAGRLLLPRARKLLRQANEVQQIMDSLQQKIVGDLRIACSTTAGKYILPMLSARFCERHPGVRVTILACTRELVLDELVQDEADLGVVSYETTREGFESQEFFEDFINLVVPADHRWADRDSIPPEELLDEPIILRHTPSGTRQVMLEGLARFDIGLEDLNVLLEIGNAEAIVHTVAAGYGVSFVSRLAATDALVRGRVAVLRVEGMDLRRKIYMVRQAMEAPTRAMESFWRFVHDPANTDLLRLAKATP